MISLLQNLMGLEEGSSRNLGRHISFGIKEGENYIGVPKLRKMN